MAQRRSISKPSVKQLRPTAQHKTTDNLEDGRNPKPQTRNEMEGFLLGVFLLGYFCGFLQLYGKARLLPSQPERTAKKIKRMEHECLSENRISPTLKRA